MANRPQARLKFVNGYGKNWRNLRENLKPKMTLEKFSNIIDIDDATICKIEKESLYPTIEQINKYQTYFDVPIDYLTGRIKASKLNLVQECRDIRLSDNAWMFIMQCKNDAYTLDILNLLFEQKEFRKIIVKYSNIKKRWDNRADINSPAALKVYKYLTEHKKELDELNCDIHPCNDTEHTKIKCKEEQFDIKLLENELQQKMIKAITGLEYF